MKKLITLALTAAISSYSYSSLALQNCIEISELAAGTMAARQSGADAVQVIEIFKTSFEEVDNAFYEASIIMVLHAYSEPKFNTRSYQQNAINEFKNQYFLECMNQ